MQLLYQDTDNRIFNLLLLSIQKQWCSFAKPSLCKYMCCIADNQIQLCFSPTEVPVLIKCPSELPNIDSCPWSPIQQYSCHLVLSREIVIFKTLWLLYLLLSRVKVKRLLSIQMYIGSRTVTPKFCLIIDTIESVVFLSECLSGYGKRLRIF